MMTKVDMDKIKEVKDRFNRLGNLNEENVKIKIVVEILKILGYEFESFDFEHEVYHRKQHADIAIKIDDNKYFYVEAKRGDKELSEYDVIQLSNYMNTNGIEWGLLSNGKELILINDNIIINSKDQAALRDRIVFKINLFKLDSKKINYLKFLTKEAIFDSRVTNYFKDIAQFKAYKYPLNKSFSSFRNYKGTLNNFFNYYADKEKEYIPIEDIRIRDFKRFLEYEQEQKKVMSRSVRSQNTFKNKYSHLRSMLNELKKRGYIHSHNFEKERDELINKLKYEEVIRDKSFLNNENVSEILKFMKSTSSPARNKTLFSLSLYMGLERSKLKNIEKRMFDLDKGIIKLDGKMIPLPNKLKLLIMELIEENKSKGINDKYLFYTHYSKKYAVITDSGINDIFTRIKNIDTDDERWSVFSPQFVRDCLIERLFENNYSIEEISYLVGMELKNISKYINSDEINNKVDLFKNKRLERKHPFEKFLN